MRIANGLDIGQQRDWGAGAELTDTMVAACNCNSSEEALLQIQNSVMEAQKYRPLFSSRRRHT
eukprot:COSAG03_NODE_9712_length_698_cov_1.053422_1_plen_63_part_00